MTEESLFAAALEKPTEAERRAFLDEACADDEALRRRVERLLSAHERTLGILDQPAQPPGTLGDTDGAPDGGVRHGPRVGTLIAGRYELLEEIGAGGMGTVWAAEQTRPVRRKVALKLIRTGMDSKSVLARFDAERQALALMDHPNIAKVLDGGTTEDGRPFFVMEYVNGVPITQYCDDARLTIERRLALFMPVCQAVQHAHTKGVIHRDLKPGNILVCQHDGQPVPKVIDFGLAKAIGPPLTELTLHTAHGLILGTPLYMSPEQAELNNLDVDTRSDVYALGVILYELLTGTTPLERRRFQQAAWLEILRLIREEDPQRPSIRLGGSDSLPSVAAQRRLEPARLTRRVRGELDWIVMKCLEKARARRYETADGLARDLRRFLADEAVEACPPSAGYRLGKLVRRYRGPIAATSAVLLLLVGGIIGTTWGMLRAERARKAEAERAESEKRAHALAQMRLGQIERGIEFLESVFKDLDPRAEEKEGRPLRSILGDRIARRAEEIHGEAIGDPLLAADLQYRLGLTLLRLSMPRRAIPIFEKTRAIRASRLGADHRDTLTSMCALAEGYHAAGDLDRALPLLEQTLELRKARLGPDDSDTLFSANNLAEGYRAVGKLEPALPLLEETLARRKARLGPDHPDTLNSMNNLATAYEDAERLDRALPLLEETLARRKAKLGPDHPDTLNSMNNLADCYRVVRQLDRALPLLAETLARRKATLGADHSDTLISMNNLAAAYKDAGDLELALPLLEETLKLSRAKRGDENPYTLGGMNNLAWAYRAAGKPEAALRLFREAATIIEKRGFRDRFADGIVSNLAGTLERLEQFAEAETWRRRWAAAVKEQTGADSLRYAGELGMLGSNLLHQSKWIDAEAILREALAILERRAPASVARFNIQSELGSALAGQARYAEAEPLLIQGHEGIKSREAQLPPSDRDCVVESGEQVIRLYEAWGRAEKAVEWRKRLSEPDGTKSGP
jgi:hypothetical protein